MATRIQTQERIARKRKQLELLYKAIEGSIEHAEIESYAFSDGNGNQNIRRRSLAEQQKLITELEKEIDTLECSLRGGGIQTFGTNRYG